MFFLDLKRRNELRRFLVRDTIFLNFIIVFCAFGVLLFLMQMIFPSWFVDRDRLYEIYGEYSEATYLREASGENGQSGMWLVIFFLFGATMCMIKGAFYHRKFVVGFDKVKYTKSYQKLFFKHSLSHYFSYSNHYFPIDVIRESEIVSHKKEDVVPVRNNEEMLLSNGCFTGNVFGSDIVLGNVMCKGTYKHKGSTQVTVVYNALTISLDLHADVSSDFRLKLIHDRTGKWFGQLFQFSKFDIDALVKMNDRKLEKLFKIYSNNPTEAESFLTDERKDVFKKWKSTLDKNMKVTIINKRLTISFPHQIKLLNPAIYKKCTLEKFEKNTKVLEDIISDLEIFNDKVVSAKGHAV